jgi:hypothetical protein
MALSSGSGLCLCRLGAYLISNNPILARKPITRWYHRLESTRSPPQAVHSRAHDSARELLSTTMSTIALSGATMTIKTIRSPKTARFKNLDACFFCHHYLLLSSSSVCMALVVSDPDDDSSEWAEECTVQQCKMASSLARILACSLFGAIW